MYDVRIFCFMNVSKGYFSFSLDYGLVLCSSLCNSVPCSIQHFSEIPVYLISMFLNVTLFFDSFLAAFLSTSVRLEDKWHPFKNVFLFFGLESRRRKLITKTISV